MNVKELIEKLRLYPPDMQVIYGKHSEFCLLEDDDISVEKACLPRDDGWVPRKRPDKPMQEYLAFSGN